MKHPDRNPWSIPIDLVANDNAMRSSVRLLMTASGMDVHEYRTMREYLTTRTRSHRCLVADSSVADNPDCLLCMEVIRGGVHTPIVVLTDVPEEFGFARVTHSNVRIIRKPFNGEYLINAIIESTGTGTDKGDEDHAPQDARPAAS